VDYVAYFSSLGPTYDNRIKPDVVAPGAGLMSALASRQNSNEKTCETTFKQGTSMATPAVAGAAALIRQYFIDKEGKFWTKACSPSSDMFCTAFTPSGMLLKALLLHSGEAMSLYHEGSSSKDVVLSGKGKPDVYQGYGRVQLSNVLPLPGLSDFQLTVRDMVDIQEKSAVSHYFKVTDPSQPLVITISWYDPPAVSGAAKALVNDLDLLLKLPDKKGTIYGNFKKKRDDVNNNERIVIQNPVKGKYKAIVKAKALPVGGHQRFAFVLTYGGKPLDTQEIAQFLEEKREQEQMEGVERASVTERVAFRVKTFIDQAFAHARNFFKGAE
jgi:hypothetical protein